LELFVSGEQLNSGFIGTAEQYPEALQDNEFLETGYRCEFVGWFGAFRTLFMWHNETVNIWTHLLGAVAFMTLVFTVLARYPDMQADGNQIMNEFSKTRLENNGLTLDLFIE